MQSSLRNQSGKPISVKKKQAKNKNNRKGKKIEKANKIKHTHIHARTHSASLMEELQIKTARRDVFFSAALDRHLHTYNSAHKKLLLAVAGCVGCFSPAHGKKESVTTFPENTLSMCHGHLCKCVTLTQERA